MLTEQSRIFTNDDMMSRCCFSVFPGVLSRILVIAAIFISAVSGQECTDTIGSLNHDSNFVTVDRTYILAGYTVPCNSTVVAWEFCYRIGSTLVTFQPGIWRITSMNNNNVRDYTLVQSNNITYNASIQTSGTSNDQCQIVNLSVTDQFTAPAGSVVGLYSGIFTQLLRTTNTDSSITTYQFNGNQSSVTINPGSTDVSYNLAVRIHFVLSSIVTSTMSPVTTGIVTSSTDMISGTTTTSTVPAPDTQSSRDSSDGSSVGIIVGCIIGVVLFITLLLLVVILLWYFSRRRKGKLALPQGTQNYELTATKCDVSQEPTGTIDNSDNYSTQHRTKQNKVADYETSSGIFGYEDNEESNNMSPYLDPLGNNYSKIAGNDYEAIHNTHEYESAVQVYSNNVRESTNNDDTMVSVYSEVGDADGTTANDEEEIYSDPGHSEADIYACFEKKKFRMIKRNDISFSQKLGSGEFGTVHLGLWTKSSADPVQVAVKTLNSQCSVSDRVKFLREAAIMGQFKGDNIVRLHGVVTEVRDSIIVLEYMSKGDLREFLIDLKNTTPPEALHELKHDLLSYCRHVAAGLSILSSKGFVHRDLAARNILVSSDDVCKIADFGMARDVKDNIYYVSTGGKIPVRWTAPEAIFYKKYSVQSDVWSFGCVMYEIWSLGHKPFEDDDGQEYIEKITTGYRLSPPPGCPRAIYELMIKCWHPVANQRIDSSAIVNLLQKSDRTLLPGTISAKDNEELSTTLGDPLDTSSNLYQDLQNTYLFTK